MIKEMLNTYKHNTNIEIETSGFTHKFTFDKGNAEKIISLVFNKDFHLLKLISFGKEYDLTIYVKTIVILIINYLKANEPST